MSEQNIRRVLEFSKKALSDSDPGDEQPEWHEKWGPSPLSKMIHIGRIAYFVKMMLGQLGYDAEINIQPKDGKLVLTATLTEREKPTTQTITDNPPKKD